MITKTREHIINYIKANKQVRVRDLVRVLNLSSVAIHKQLKKLLASGQLRKIGQAPTVFYVLQQQRETGLPIIVSEKTQSSIDKNYVYITPQGELLYGLDGFTRWTENTQQSDKISHLAELYVSTLFQYERYRSSQGWIDATFKLTDTFPRQYLDKLLYADFYSFPQFGKTKLGTLMLYAKQSQSRELAGIVCSETKLLVAAIIDHFKIDAVAYIPPSIPRTMQLMSELASGFAITRPHIELVKTRTGKIIVAQKSLEKLAERVVNAQNTIFLKNTKLPFNNILLIDDAVGSGATMNETAKKIKDIFITAGQPAKTIIGFAVVGSFKGFEVIREV